MSRQEARKELKAILANQQTVKISRLSKIIDAIRIEQLVRQNVEQGERIQRQTERLRKLELRR